MKRTRILSAAPLIAGGLNWILADLAVACQVTQRRALPGWRGAHRHAMAS